MNALLLAALAAYGADFPTSEPATAVSGIGLLMAQGEILPVEPDVLEPLDATVLQTAVSPALSEVVLASEEIFDPPVLVGPPLLPPGGGDPPVSPTPEPAAMCVWLLALACGWCWFRKDSAHPPGAHPLPA